ncbi:hypothetical protein U0070_013670, partial [Myodes glareolus]
HPRASERGDDSCVMSCQAPISHRSNSRAGAGENPEAASVLTHRCGLPVVLVQLVPSRVVSAQSSPHSVLQGIL